MPSMAMTVGLFWTLYLQTPQISPVEDRAMISESRLPDLVLADGDATKISGFDRVPGFLRPLLPGLHGLEGVDGTDGAAGVQLGEGIDLGEIDGGGDDGLGGPVVDAVGIGRLLDRSE